MKSLEFIFQDTQIHFLLQNEGEVMVNATEMAKVFQKRIDVFLKSDHAKAFIKVLQFPPNGVNSEEIPMDKIIQTRGHMGTFFNRLLALKFAAWLDPEFEVW
ncbi:MAG: KilA-N domain-containing protein, partial [Gillisia sp.]